MWHNLQPFSQHNYNKTGNIVHAITELHFLIDGITSIRPQLSSTYVGMEAERRQAAYWLINSQLAFLFNWNFLPTFQVHLNGHLSHFYHLTAAAARTHTRAQKVQHWCPANNQDKAKNIPWRWVKHSAPDIKTMASLSAIQYPAIPDHDMFKK